MLSATKDRLTFIQYTPADTIRPRWYLVRAVLSKARIVKEQEYTSVISFTNTSLTRISQIIKLGGGRSGTKYAGMKKEHMSTDKQCYSDPDENRITTSTQYSAPN